MNDRATKPPATRHDAETVHGPICGYEAGGAIAFYDVPYGASTARRRFLVPEPPSPWTEVRDIGTPIHQAPQYRSGLHPSLLRSWHVPLVDSEDCLFVHLWTPALDGRARPVMVWLHGGGFSAGSAYNLGYDGTRLAARHEVVVVSVSHRLNVFGHLFLGELGPPELADSGNLGMLDVVLALQWVRDNVAGFGGDPRNVTVFGQSGGGGKVTALLAMPKAGGLFHRAIVQSSSTGIGGRSAGSATEDAIAFMDELGLSPSQVGELRRMPRDRLVEAMHLLTQRTVDRTQPWSPLGRREWRPVVDGRSFPEPAFYPAAHSWSADVPLLVGTTKDECRLHLGASNPAAFDITWEVLPLVLGVALGGESASTIDFYRNLDPSASASDLLFRIFTFCRWRYSAIWLAERKVEQRAAPVYAYRLDWETPVEGGRWRAPHALDIAFVFDNVAASSSMVGDAPDAQRLADQMAAAWVAFARTGSPQTGALPAWPAYSLDGRSTMCFNATSQIVGDPESDERMLWSKKPPRLPL